MDADRVARDAIGTYGAVQEQWELATLLGLLDQAAPKLILEIGCWSGGTLYAWSHTGAAVIGVTHPMHANVLRPHGAEILLADSKDCRKELAGLLAGRTPDFVFIDGDHSEGMAKSDWRLSQQVAPGALVGFHDIACPGEPGPRKAFDAAAARYRSVTIIHPREQKGIGLVYT